MHTATIDTPDGKFTVITSDDTLLASGWTADVDSLVALIHPTLRPEPGPAPSSSAVLNDALRAVEAYYGGDHDAPAAIPVHQTSGDYRMHAWKILRDVAAGERLTYTGYAQRTGRPKAVRAAAGACAFNAAALFVPCHRILRTDGTLGGFRYGLDIKQALLTRERS
ncbi:methylated-DNA--[protein]-cysteine S-methyltransferase [Myceligenerans crystallogenes]|uniref:Methylated-DNA--[protein]-cysteine S-methyltransferase n=1 Tax=Myceligenerans crystallogenes TaxID=316335 RepID=A0ABN2NF88_9MICO